MNLNPIYKREAASISRARRMVAAVLIFNAIVTAVAMFHMFLMVEQVKLTNEMQYGTFLEMYTIVAAIEFILLTILVPALTAGTISGERERQTLDLMLITRMKPAAIIIGKLMSAFQLLFVLHLSSLPVLSFVFIYGGLQLTDLLVLLVQFYVSALFAGSFSIWLSTVLKRTAIATVCSYITLLVFYGGTMGISFLAYYIQRMRYADYIAYSSINIGGLVYILLLNPGVSFYALIGSQTGAVNTILKLCRQFGEYQTNFIFQNWLAISIAIQLLLAIFFLFLAAKSLNPLKRKRIRGE